MKNIIQMMGFVFIAIALLAALTACSKPSGPFTVNDPFIRATPQTISAGYFTITNHTKADETLVSMTADWAGRIEFHMMQADKDKPDVMNMVPVADIVVPAGKTVAFQPGGLHVMLYDLKGPMEVGETREATLNLKAGAPLKIEFKVKPITYKGLENHH